MFAYDFKLFNSDYINRIVWCGRSVLYCIAFQAHCCRCSVCVYGLRWYILLWRGLCVCVLLMQEFIHTYFLSTASKSQSIIPSVKFSTLHSASFKFASNKTEVTVLLSFITTGQLSGSFSKICADINLGGQTTVKSTFPFPFVNIHNGTVTE